MYEENLEIVVRELKVPNNGILLEEYVVVNKIIILSRIC